MAFTRNADGFVNVVVVAAADYQKLLAGEKVEQFSIAGKAIEMDGYDNTKATCLPRKVAKTVVNKAVELLPTAQANANGIAVIPFEKHGDLMTMLNHLGLKLALVVRDNNHQDIDESDHDDDLEL